MSAVLLGCALGLATVAAGVGRLRRVEELVARASHEIRGPLTAALLAVEGMGLPPEEASQLEAHLRRAELALDDLAAATTGRTAPDRLEAVPAAGLLAELAAAWRPVAAARGRELRVSGTTDGARLLADPTRLAQAVGNLVANALEHGGDGPVELRGRVLGDRVRLEVRDAGPGMPAPVEMLARRPRGPRGRGLAVAGGIAQRHGGRLVAAPSARGAVLALELPQLGAAAQDGRRRHAVPSAPSFAGRALMRCLPARAPAPRHEAGPAGEGAERLA